MPLLVDKPQDFTSFDIVAITRGALKIKKVGHAGTLDPMATGLLIVLVGREETKLQDSFMGLQKEYIGEITLGQVSTTFDAEGEIGIAEGMNKNEVAEQRANITTESINEVVKTFVGTIQQRPPIYSAIKKNGQRMYKLAREGAITAEDVPTREVTIYGIQLGDIDLTKEFPTIQFTVQCSKGTYIRSLANDIGAALGVGGYLSMLRRTKIGDYSVEDAITVETLRTGNVAAGHVAAI